MSKPQQPLVRKVIRLPPELWEKVSEYRFDSRIDSENSAFMRLLEAGLEVKHAPGCP